MTNLVNIQAIIKKNLFNGKDIFLGAKFDEINS
jgi:hypothetical protein